MTPLTCCLCGEGHFAIHCPLARSTLAAARGETEGMAYRVEPPVSDMIAVHDAVTAVAQGLWRQRAVLVPETLHPARAEHERRRA